MLNDGGSILAMSFRLRFRSCGYLTGMLCVYVLVGGAWATNGKRWWKHFSHAVWPPFSFPWLFSRLFHPSMGTRSASVFVPVAV